MNHRLVSLSDFFTIWRARQEPLVLATLIHTIGSTYRKAGAQMLLAADGSAAGLLSGGCLEADLLERAAKVLGTGEAVIASYDTRSSDDLIWGIGLGCEGAMDILLAKLHAGNDYQPFAYIDASRRAHVPTSFALVTQSENPAYPLGHAYWIDAPASPPQAIQEALRSVAAGAARRIAGNVLTRQTHEASFLIAPVELPIRLLVLGAGPDVMPLVEIAGLMGWQVSVFDHRPAYAVSERFPRAQEVAVRPANKLHEVLRPGIASFDAAVVMSHHLISDEAYLRALADSSIAYIGLLGPAPRRTRLLNDLGEKAKLFGNRLYGPIGLDIGAGTPETIALAIVSEIQAVMNGRDGGRFSRGVMG